MQAQIKRYWPLFLVLNTLLFNEYLIFHFSILLNCSWPCDEHGSCQHNSLRVKYWWILTCWDSTRGIGSINSNVNGRCTDPIKQHCISDSEAIFFVGDLMDEGQWTDERLFNAYADRVDELFSTSTDGPPVHVLAGNHDFGFHYEMHPHRIGWFRSRFNKSIVDTVHIKGQPFILFNSMAMNGDVQTSRGGDDRISSLMTSARNSSCTDKDAKPFRSNKRPIQLQHFPSLAKPAQQDPTTCGVQRHSHIACKKKWTRPVEFWEHTVNSFSWRNGDRPSFLMVSIDDKQVRVSTCHLPRESVCIFINVATGVILVLWLPWRFYTLSLDTSRGHSFELISC